MTGVAGVSLVIAAQIRAQFASRNYPLRLRVPLQQILERLSQVDALGDHLGRVLKVHLTLVGGSQKAYCTSILTL